MANLETDSDEQVARILDEVVAKIRTGSAIDVAAWQARYPDVADELPALLSTVRDFDTAVADWKAAPGSTETFADGSTPEAPARQPETTAALTV